MAEVTTKQRVTHVVITLRFEEALELKDALIDKPQRVLTSLRAQLQAIAVDALRGEAQ